MPPVKPKALAWLAAAAIALAFGAATPTASAATRFSWMQGFAAPGTPKRLDKVGLLKVGPPKAKNVLILNPGTSASAAYFAPLARDIVKRTTGWQVWAIERRENLLEDHSMLNRVKLGTATPRQLFDYYLGFLSDSSVKTHFQFIQDSQVSFARRWGMRVTVEDLRQVVEAARRNGHRVVMAGHSLGGSITTAYATWNFHGKPGASDLDGLVFIDGGSNPVPTTPQQASTSLNALNSGSPWLKFGGIGAPFAGLFNIVGSTLARVDPNGPSTLQTWPLLPSYFKTSVPVTNEAGYGSALDTKTSPPALAAAQAHLGHLAASGDPRAWVRAGAITPIRRYEDMFSGTGLIGRDGTGWYHPMRLTIDAGAVAEGNANPAQSILDVRATRGRELPKRLRIYAFGAALGGKRVLDAARFLANQSGIPSRNLTLVDRHSTYAHNDPAGASPRNAFLDHLVTFLGRIGR